jgi:hypothetical protein
MTFQHGHLAGQTKSLLWQMGKQKYKQKLLTDTDT